MKAKKSNTKVIKGLVTDLLVENRDYTAREIKQKVEKMLKGKYHFTERTYQNIKKKLLLEFSDDPIDMLWSVGVCVKYEIPGDVIPLLLEVKRSIPPDEILTIRTAQWIAKLHTIIKDRTDLSHLYYISTYYGLYERICALAQITFNTSKPDSMIPNSEKVKEAFIELLSQGGAE